MIYEDYLDELRERITIVYRELARLKIMSGQKTYEIFFPENEIMFSDITFKWGIYYV